MNIEPSKEIKNQQQKSITDFFKPKPIKVDEIIKGYNPKTGHHHCFECGIDMGFSYSQLCHINCRMN